MTDEQAPFSEGHITGLLRAVETGDRAALDELFAGVYQELRRLARNEIAAAPPRAAVNTTTLVHETYLKMSRGAPWSLRDRFHFFATVARAMRMVLIDHARRRTRAKRGGGELALSLDEARLPSTSRPEELLALDEALERLEAADPELARVVEWRFFAGLSVEEIARTLEVSERTVKRHWRAARAFLFDELSGKRLAP